MWYLLCGSLLRNCRFPIIYKEIEGAEQTFELNGYRLKAFRVNHNVLCYGYTMEIDRAGKFDVERAKEQEIPQKYWKHLQKGETIETENGILTPDMVLGPPRKGLKLTYTTDTRPTNSIRENAKDSDLFICEGMYGEKEKAAKAVEYKHMTFYEAAHLAKDAQVKEMWLTHYSPSLTRRKSIWMKCAGSSRKPRQEKTECPENWHLSRKRFAV